MTIKEIQEQIDSKWEEIRELREKKSYLETGEITTFLKGKFFKFEDDGDTPIELCGKYIYIPENNIYNVHLMKRSYKNEFGNYDVDLWIDCMSVNYSVTEYADETYFSYDAYDQIKIPYQENLLTRLMRTAKPITKEEFLNAFEKGMNEAFNDLKETLEGNNDENK